jgi:pSer/pThr/pTyr-binding forkhead associated (FHA) protein
MNYDALDDYDAYHLWLGIPPEEQPPSHYRLLGLRLFEENMEVIRNAADRQRSQVKRLGVNQFQQIGQELLNQIEAAKICLLRPEKRQVYDEQLRNELRQREALRKNSTFQEASIEETWIIGSDRSCDIVIDLPIISGIHCSVMRRQDRVLLRDLKSTNGTFLNFTRVVQPMRIAPTDLIVLGRDTRLKLPRTFFPAAERGSRALFIGRSEQCDIHIDDSSVSSFHARILIDNSGLAIEDFGSTNGTSLIDHRGRLNKLRPHLPVSFVDWEKISFGKHQLPLSMLLKDTQRLLAD